MRSSVTATGFDLLLGQRWSCRAYLPDPVPDAVVREMFGIAQRTASWCNTQPWQVYVTSGEATRRFARSLTEHAKTHEPAPDLPMPAGYHGVYRERRRGAGYALYRSLGIRREDRDAREAQRLRNFEFFGAPHVAVVTTDREQGVYGAIDCGGYVANLLNAATALGVATIPQAAIAMHADHVHRCLGIPAERLVVCAVSFGYADTAHPVNRFRTDRAQLDDAVVFLGGD
ncbi:nitroreductase [Amycolatopsis viridis]|uniref:Nitroreductase n=1 Tax=Amycolatopsis viridis TaxID=185678 RepID=A0ABX0SUX4_9PSEU|nr:nitroreductase [Amycolatopsis viridis]NIH80708.1 nitroreductase [Amycolatopsis viridis]